MRCTAIIDDLRPHALQLAGVAVTATIGRVVGTGEFVAFSFDPPLLSHVAMTNQALSSANVAQRIDGLNFDDSDGTSTVQLASTLPCVTASWRSATALSCSSRRYTVPRAPYSDGSTPFDANLNPATVQVSPVAPH